eukprot:4240795-Alexandrium_andersonii.AAC.1
MGNHKCWVKSTRVASRPVVGIVSVVGGVSAMIVSGPLEHWMPRQHDTRCICGSMHRCRRIARGAVDGATRSAVAWGKKHSPQLVLRCLSQAARKVILPTL